MAELSHRASDAEREAVADRLRAAAAEGRLDPDELEERLGAAYSARTAAELVPLTSDLPVGAPPEPPRESVWQSQQLRKKIAGFIVINVICIAVWLASGASGDGGGFWPGWVLLGTGIGIFSTIVRAVLGVEEDDEEEDERRRRRRHLRA